MQPAAASDNSGMVVNKKGARSAEGSYVNSEAFWRKKIADVPVDQVLYVLISGMFKESDHF
jgi:ribosome biogenesis protein MAK21